MFSLKTAILSLILALSICQSSQLSGEGPEALSSQIFVTSQGGQVSYFSNYDITTPNSNLTRAIIIIHGIARNNTLPYEAMLQVISDQGRSSDTVVTAPRFPVVKDNAPADYSYWTEDGWSSGDPSLDATGVSSYTVMDQLITQILVRPSIREIILTGMSAGGQFVQKYAAGNSIESRYPHVHFRYVVVSPSSYMYLSAKRKVQGTSNSFSVPQNPGCNYNDYKYGIVNRNAYMNKSDTQLVSDYLARDVVYMIGSQDNATSSPNHQDPKGEEELDLTCPAEWQGASRLDRAITFEGYLSSIFPQSHQTLVVVPGVAHQDAIFTSPLGETLY